MESTPATPGTFFNSRRNDPFLHGAQVTGLGDLIRKNLAFWRQIAAIGLPAWCCPATRRAPLPSGLA
jgi:hypothetical protein